MTGSPPPRFVVGTGRCGSTLLSRMLSQNPEVLSVFEFFSGIDQFFRFQEESVDGAELGRRLRQDHPMLTMVLARGYEVPEVVYPFGEPGVRFALGDPVPWILGIALARVSEDPDALFDALMDYVDARPRQPLAKHYREIFAWLASRLGRSCWIERSGSSIEYVGELARLFPDARFVHIHRDGCETALSMREYPVLRVSVAVMYGLLGDIEYSHEGLSALEASEAGAIDRLLETRPPVELFGRYWAEQIANGHDAVRQLGPERMLDLRFEDMVARPQAELTRLADFLELPGGRDWIGPAASLVRGMPPRRLPGLESGERRALQAACAGSMALLSH